VRLSAHGIEIDMPRGWEARIYRRPGADATLHAASFGLPATDGDFGSGATARMPPGGTFFVVKEYRPDARLVPGAGLFAPRSIPLPLRAHHFHSRSLQVGRAGQAGFQHFFTTAGRPFCLYAVIAAAAEGGVVAGGTHRQADHLSGILSSLTIHRRR
jgi:hypothetical protein